MANKTDLLLLFDRPQEPAFARKGDDETYFDVPSDYLTDRYKAIGLEVTNRFNADRKIPVKQISLPDMRIPMSLGRNEQFSLWIPRHRKIAGRLIDIFMGMRSIEDLQSAAVYARDRVNPLLFNYAMSVALLHRPDTKDLNLPSFIETFPDRFVDSKVFSKVREEATIVDQASNRMPIVIPKDYTASDLEAEHRLWYFREDLGVNLHHWHWHLVYPFEATNSALVNKDRRGELFYYMHQQIIARYNFDRFSNNLPRVKRLNNFREPIPEAYFPKMDSLVASRAWPPRATNTYIQDLNRQLDQIKFDVTDLERWRDRFYEAVNQGFAVNASGQQIPLDEVNGINILGNMMEASSTLSPNAAFYGDLHNTSHVFIAFSHDPDHRHLESFGVMGDSATAMRDPVFYRWHAQVDDMFQQHKIKLTPYTEQQLTFPDVTVDGISVSSNGAANTFSTFWQQSDVDFSRGLDFSPSKGSVFARFTHLNHAPFSYSIQVSNNGATRQGMVRIFLAPTTDERGQPMLFQDQRLLMIELDKFVATLNPGVNTLRRRDEESTVTIPYARTFRNYNANVPAAGTAALEEYNFCGCGWPEHMLIPKGLPEGLNCELFVMVSNYEEDRVDQSLDGICNDAASYCGVRDRLYPDRKAMGYPFDRLSRAGADSLNTFLTPNMAVQSCRIVHSNTTTQRPRS